MASTTALQFLSGVPVEWIVVGVVFVGGAIDGYISGGVRAGAAALALPIAVLLSGMAMHAFALGATLSAAHAGAYPAAIIAVLFIGLFFIIGRMSGGWGLGGPVSAFLAGLGTVAVVAAVWMATPVLAAFVPADSALRVFFGEAYRLYWVVAGYVALALARG